MRVAIPGLAAHASADTGVDTVVLGGEVFGGYMDPNLLVPTPSDSADEPHPVVLSTNKERIQEFILAVLTHTPTILFVVEVVLVVVLVVVAETLVVRITLLVPAGIRSTVGIVVHVEVPVVPLVERVERVEDGRVVAATGVVASTSTHTGLVIPGFHVLAVEERTTGERVVLPLILVGLGLLRAHAGHDGEGVLTLSLVIVPEQVTLAIALGLDSALDALLLAHPHLVLVGALVGGDVAEEVLPALLIELALGLTLEVGLTPGDGAGVPAGQGPVLEVLLTLETALPLVAVAGLAGPGRGVILLVTIVEVVVAVVAIPDSAGQETEVLEGGGFFVGFIAIRFFFAVHLVAETAVDAVCCAGIDDRIQHLCGGSIEAHDAPFFAHFGALHCIRMAMSQFARNFQQKHLYLEKRYEIG